MKKVDGAVGSTLARFWPRPIQVNISPGPPRRLLLIRPGGLGDAVLLVPAIRAFKKAFPDCEVTVLAERRNGAVFALCPEVAQVLLYDRPGELLKAMRRRYDLIIDTEQWHHLSAVMARLIRSQAKIGFATNDRKRLFNFEISYSHKSYEVESFLHLLKPLGLEGAKIDFPFLQIPERFEKQAEEVSASLGERPFVALFPGASIPERRWGAENFHKLASWLNGEGMPAVVVGGEQDRSAGDTILTGIQGLNLAGKTSLAGTAAILRRSRLLVSGDSGVLHLAVGLDVPTVSLFGPGIATKWAPRGEKHIVLNKNLPCSPCTRFGYTPPCPDGGRCIREISVDEVSEAVKAVTSGW